MTLIRLENLSSEREGGGIKGKKYLGEVAGPNRKGPAFCSLCGGGAGSELVAVPSSPRPPDGRCLGASRDPPGPVGLRVNLCVAALCSETLPA